MPFTVPGGPSRLRPPLWPANPGGVSPAARGLWRDVNTAIPFWVDNHEFLSREAPLSFPGTMGAGPLGRAMVTPTSNPRFAQYTNQFRRENGEPFSIAVTVDRSGRTSTAEGMVSSGSLSIFGDWLFQYSVTRLQFAYRRATPTIVVISATVGFNQFNDPGARSVVITYDPNISQFSWYFQGVLVSETTSGPIVFLDNGRPLNVASSTATSSLSMLGAYYGVHLWDRALSAAEVALLHIDPFAMYRRTRRRRARLFFRTVEKRVALFGAELRRCAPDAESRAVVFPADASRRAAFDPEDRTARFPAEPRDEEFC